MTMDCEREQNLEAIFESFKASSDQLMPAVLVCVLLMALVSLTLGLAWVWHSPYTDRRAELKIQLVEFPPTLHLRYTINLPKYMISVITWSLRQISSSIGSIPSDPRVGRT